MAGNALACMRAPHETGHLTSRCTVQIGRTMRVGGWVKTGREAGAGAFTFLDVNDGSCFESLQVSISGPCA